METQGRFSLSDDATSHEGCANIADVKRKPDPDCKLCKGLGKLQLVFSVVDCDCVAEPPTSGVPDEIDDAVTDEINIADDFDLDIYDIFNAYYGCVDDADDDETYDFGGSDMVS